MALVSSEVNRSRWDPAYKFDSYGARMILNELFSGRLIDLEASLEDVRKIIDRRPGRVSAGKAVEWGGTFKIGEAYVYSFLSSYGFDELLPFSRQKRATQPFCRLRIFEAFRRLRVRSASTPPTTSRLLGFGFAGPKARNRQSSLSSSPRIGIVLVFASGELATSPVQDGARSS